MVTGISKYQSFAQNKEAVKNMNEKLAQSNTDQSSHRLAAIKSKMRQGIKLSANDKSYLQKNAPALYRKAVQVERKRDKFEHKIKNCKSKEEFNRLRMEVTQSAVDIGDSSSIGSAQAADTAPVTGADGSSLVQDGTVTYETGGINNYLYRSLDSAYRAFKQSTSFHKLPLKNTEKRKIDMKI